MPKLPDIQSLAQTLPQGANRAQLSVDQAPLPQTFSRAPIRAPSVQGGGTAAMLAGVARSAGDFIEKEIEKKADFNAARAKSHFLQETLRIQTELEQSPDFENMVGSFDQQMSETMQNALSMVEDPDRRAALELEFQNSYARSKSSVSSLAHKRGQEFAIDETNNTIDKNREAYIRAKDDATRADLLNANNEALQALENSGAITREDRLFRSRSAVESYTTARAGLLPLSERLKLGPDKNGNFPETGTYVDKIPLEQRLKIYNSARSEAKTVNAGIRQEIKEEAADISDAGKLGLSVPRSNIEALAKKAREADMESVANDLLRYADIQDEVSDFAVKPLKDQSADLQSLKDKIEDGSTGDVDRFDAMHTVYVNKLKMVKENPWEYYSSHEIIDAPEPVNISNPEELAAAIQNRKASIARIREMEGFTMPLLMKGEISQIKDVYENGTPDEKTSVVVSLGSSLDFEDRRALSQAVAKAAPMMTVAMTLPPEKAEILLRGDEAKGEVTAATLRDEVNEVIKGVIFDPEALEGTHEAIYAYYKQLSINEGDTSERVSTERMEKAIRDIVGEVAVFSFQTKGSPVSRVITYQDESGNFVSENRLEDILGGITDEVIAQATGEFPIASDGNRIAADDILRKGRFVSAGDGLYISVFPGLGVISKRDGSPFIFDARQLERIQNGRP